MQVFNASQLIGFGGEGKGQPGQEEEGQGAGDPNEGGGPGDEQADGNGRLRQSPQDVSEKGVGVPQHPPDNQEDGGQTDPDCFAPGELPVRLATAVPNISGDVEGLFPDQDGWYVTFGYRAGKYLPHLTVASVESEPLSQAIGASQGSTQDSVTLGLRYELNDSASLKFEYQMISLDDTLMTTNPAAPGNNGFFNSQSVLEDDKANMISMAIDVIF